MSEGSELGMLTDLKVEITWRCPLNCLHCSSEGSMNATEQLDLALLLRFIYEFAESGGKRISISGGEPLCYESLASILDTCYKAGLSTTLYSTGLSLHNGNIQPIDDGLVKVIKQNDVRFISSLHGAYAETHDKLTGVTGSFEVTLQAIKKLIAVDVAVEAHVVPMRVNYDELGIIAELLASLGVLRISWLRFVPQGRGWHNRKSLQLDKGYLSQLGEIRRGLAQSLPQVNVRMGSPFNVLCPENPVRCEAGRSILTIRPDGSIAPCDAFKRFITADPFGSLLLHPLKRVWKDSYTLNAIRRLHSEHYKSTCASCKFYEVCKSGCLAQKAIVEGKLSNGPDPECLLRGFR